MKRIDTKLTTTSMKLVEEKNLLRKKEHLRTRLKDVSGFESSLQDIQAMKVLLVAWFCVLVGLASVRSVGRLVGAFHSIYFCRSVCLSIDQCFCWSFGSSLRVYFPTRYVSVSTLMIVMKGFDRLIFSVGYCFGR